MVFIINQHHKQVLGNRFEIRQFPQILKVVVLHVLYCYHYEPLSYIHYCHWLVYF